MKGLIATLLVIITAGVVYLAYGEFQKRNAVDKMAERIVLSRVADGLRAAGGPKVAVTEYYDQHGEFPNSLEEADVRINSASLPDHIKSVSLGPAGKIIVGYYPQSLNVPARVSHATLTLVPEPTASGGLSWSCVPSLPFGEHTDILPAACWP